MTQAVPVAGDIGAGHVLGRYELLLPIASGGMAMVWAARLRGTRGFQKIVAVKTMLPKLSEDDQFEQMFLDEASLASQIRHPHVVEILDLGEQDGVLFLVMEWIDGVPLNQLMKAAKRIGGIPLPVAVRVVMQACAGLHAAHELRDGSGSLVGLVHRDVSPQNILVTYDGVTKVVDFGVAKATALNDGLTAAGQIKGKVAYMAPEQVRGAAIDRRVDVFAMGIVLYALTTGKHPFRRESEAATMYNIASPSPVVPPRTIIQGYPPELEQVVLRALAKDVDRRFTTANEMLRALDALPANIRASTDDDVGQFVRELLLDRREERRVALAKALETADLQAESRVNLRELITEQRAPSTTTLTPVTAPPPGPSDASVAAPLHHTTLSGQTNASLSNLSVAMDPSIRRKRWLLASIALLASGALGAVLFMQRGAAENEHTTAVKAAPQAPTAVERPAAVEATPAVHSAPSGSAEAEGADLDAGAPSANSDAAASATTPSTPRTKARAPSRPSAPKQQAPETSPPAKNWRHNPGF